MLLGTTIYKLLMLIGLSDKYGVKTSEVSLKCIEV